MGYDRDFLIWLAGFVDGEACITPAAMSPYSHWRLSIYQNNAVGKQVLEQIQTGLGFGTISHRTKRGLDEWILNINRREDLLMLLPRLLPHLRVKHTRAAEAFDYLRTHRPLKRMERPRLWNPHDDSILRETYPSKGAQATARVLGRSIESVYGRIGRLGIHVNDIRMSQKQSENVKHRWRDGYGQFWRNVEAR